MDLRRLRLLLPCVLIGACSSAPEVPKTPAATTPTAETKPAAETKPVVTVRNACSLTSKADAEAVAGEPMQEPEGDTKTCTIKPVNNTGPFFMYDVMWTDGALAMKTVSGSVDAAAGGIPGMGPKRIENLGDVAVMQLVLLHVRRGDVYLMFDTRAAKNSQVIEFAKKVVAGLDRIQPPTALSGPADAIAGALLGAVMQQMSDPSAPPSSNSPPKALPEGVTANDECPEPTAGADAEIKTQEAALIPLKEGLTMSHIWVGGGAQAYEHECLAQITNIDTRAVTVSNSCSFRDAKRDRTMPRMVCRPDLRGAYVYHTAFHASYPSVILGSTTFSLSGKSFAALKDQGETRHRYLQLRPSSDPPRASRDDDGALKRVAKDTYKIIVNDRQVELPVMKVAGTVGGAETRAVVLDDPRFPLMLDYATATGFSIRLTKISFPTENEIEKHLATEKHVDVYGIYFDFASDVLRPESEPVLREIGEALSKNRDWKLNIQGHTDNVGGDTLNMDLSRRRSEAVRKALVDRFSIDGARLATAGFGASRPKESNDTVEGRAKNRRVELVRQ